MRTLYTKECKHCHRKFKTFDNSMEFCNVSCRFNFEAENEKELDFGKEIEKELRLENNLEKKLCILCGWEFTPKSNSQLCCSKECSHNLQKQRARKNAIIRYYRKKNEGIKYRNE